LRETAALVKTATLVAPADVTDAVAMRGVVEQAMQKFGRVDAVVNNAGYAPLRKIEQMTLDEWRMMIDTNLSATFYLSQAVWPIFRKQKGGVIVNLSSRAARDPFEGLTPYGSAKAAINLLTLGWAREGQAIGVRVHAVAPGAVETGMFRSLMSPEQFPTEKTLAPSDVAKVVADCITGELAHTSGEVIWLHKTV
jgi:NAD(P)-dependent dehydrogenase (short-subunit alcohol dehydrogenase family)